jgi:hypothetical protein
VERASVVKQGINTTANLQTDSYGGYPATNLTPGTYTVEAKKTGFTRRVYRDLVVQVAQVARLDISLDVGAVEQTVAVTGATQLLQTEVRARSSGFALIEVKGKFGYIDHSGTLVIKPEFLDGIDFSDGMARMVAEGPCIYFPDGPCGFANPHYVGGRQQRTQTLCKFTYIDKTGRVITRDRVRFLPRHITRPGYTIRRKACDWGGDPLHEAVTHWP